LILVAPVGKEMGKKNWENVSEGGHTEGVSAIKTMLTANEQIDEIADLVEETIIYLSDNDSYIPLSVVKSFEALNPKVHTIKNHGHFSKRAGIFEFPKILDEFPTVEEGIWAGFRFPKKSCQSNYHILRISNLLAQVKHRLQIILNFMNDLSKMR